MQHHISANIPILHTYQNLTNSNWRVSKHIVFRVGMHRRSQIKVPLKQVCAANVGFNPFLANHRDYLPHADRKAFVPLQTETPAASNPKLLVRRGHIWPFSRMRLSEPSGSAHLRRSLVGASPSARYSFKSLSSCISSPRSPARPSI